MPEPEIKINLKLDAAEAQKALEDVKRQAESLQSVNTTASSANVTVSTELTTKDTAAWRENTEVKKAATETHDALGAAVGKVSENVAVNTVTTTQNTAAWRENAEARTLAMADTEGAAERIERMAEAQAKLAQASAQAASAWTQAKKPVTDYTASLELQTKTYEELMQLYEDLMQMRTAAQTAEEVKEIDMQLNAVRKNMRLLGQEARLSGAQVIGSQRSIQGVFRATISEWRKGTLTLKALTQGMKMFAKSTVFLAAIQLAWELLTNVWEKAKTALFGTADAAEKAANEQQRLADEAERASTNLIDAQTALAAARKEEQRTIEAQSFAKAIKTQNDYYSDQIKLIDQATAAQLRQLSVTAKEDDRKYVLEKLKLQEALIDGTISEYQYQEKLIQLEKETAQNKLTQEVDKKRIAKEEYESKARIAKEKREVTEAMSEKDMTGFEMSSPMVAELIAEYNERKRVVEKLTPKYAHLPQKRERLQKFVTKFKDNKNADIQKMVKETEAALADVERRIKELDDERTAMEEAYNLLPAYVRKVGLNEFGFNQYTQEQKGRQTYNENVRRKKEEAIANDEKATEAAIKAASEYSSVVTENAKAIQHSEEIAERETRLNQKREENAKKNEANEKKIQAARDTVNSMEYATLKAEEKRLLAEAAKVGDKTPEGKRLAELAGVYTTERRSRDVEARRAKENVMRTGRDATGREAEVIAMAGKVTAQAVRNGAVDYDKLIEVAKAAIDTKGMADNVAVLNMLKTLDGLMTTIQRDSKKAKELAKQTERLKNKMSKQ